MNRHRLKICALGLLVSLLLFPTAGWAQTPEANQEEIDQLKSEKQRLEQENQHLRDWIITHGGDPDEILAEAMNPTAVSTPLPESGRDTPEEIYATSHEYFKMLEAIIWEGGGVCADVNRGGGTNGSAIVLGMLRSGMSPAEIYLELEEMYPEYGQVEREYYEYLRSQGVDPTQDGREWPMSRMMYLDGAGRFCAPESLAEMLGL